MENVQAEMKKEEVQSEQEKKPAVQVSMGRSYTDKEYPDGTLIRTIAMSFKDCTKVEMELIILAEKAFEFAFDQLHGLYDDLKLDLDGIYRYQFLSSAIALDDLFAFNETDFTRSGPLTLMTKLYERFSSKKLFKIFRSSIYLELTFLPPKTK